MADPAPIRFRSFVFPLLVVVVAAVFAFLPWVWTRADLDPSPSNLLGMLSQLGIALGIVLLACWLLFFAPFSARARWAAFALLFVLPALGLVAAVRKAEFTGSMGWLFVYRWEPDPEVELERHLATQNDAKGEGGIDLTVDPVRDFPRYRGRDADGLVEGLRMDDRWSERAPTLLWRQPCGGGYAGFAVAGNVAITVEQRKDREAVVCYDRGDGKQLWLHDWPAYFQQIEPMGGNGPRSTPTIHDGLVFALGATGHFVCLDGKDGAVEWSTNILADSKAKNVAWGMTGSPLIVEDLVVVNPGIDPEHNAGQALAAYDRKTGKRVWASGDAPAGYSSPMLATLAGVRQILLFDGGGLAGFDPKTGRELWRHPWKTQFDMNIVQPVVVGDDRVYVSSEPSNGGAMVRVSRDGDGFAVEQVWANRLLCAKFSNPVLFEGHLYGMNNGMLVCLDAQTGRRRWRGNDYGHGQILAINGELLITTEMGQVALVLATHEAFGELATLEVLHGKTWNTPAVAGRQLFVRNHKEMACYELPVRK